VARAYYELLERTSVLEALECGVDDYLVRDHEGRAVGKVGRNDVFPRSPEEATLVYSRSNGVAVASSWPAACRAAALELVERDRVLRSWYGALRPRAVPLGVWQPPTRLWDAYELEAHAFDGVDAACSVAVRGVFAFPRRPDAPLTYGFAAGATEQQALGAAMRECLQRLAFLWGEPLPAEPPAFAPTAEYHQEFFLQRSMHEHIRRWLAGRLVDRTPDLGRPAKAFPDRFVDLTPPALAGRTHVVRALPGDELPLVFGRGHPKVSGVLPAELAIHPIA
jgi:hypothetical protein